MTFILRKDKGIALSYDEMDENLRDLRFDTTLDRVLENGNISTRTLTVSTINATTDILLDGTSIDRYIDDTVGSIILDVNNLSFNLDKLTDVVISTPTSGQILSYNGTSWINAAAPDGSGITNLNSLSDVVINTPTSGQILSYNGTSWINAAAPGGSSITNLNSLTDVTISSPSTNQILSYNGTNWINTPLPSLSPINLDALTDVVITTPALNQVLRYNGTSWVNGTAPIPSINLDALTDVIVSSPITNQVIRYNGTSWVNGAVPTPSINLDALTDVVITTPSLNQVIRYNGTSWVNGAVPTPSVALSALTDVTITSPTNNQVLRYNGTRWVNSAAPSAATTFISLTDTPSSYGLPGQVAAVNTTSNGLTFIDVPTSTGVVTINREFATVTSSSLENNASANLTLTAAKTYAILIITSSVPAWIRIYANVASRTADASRLQTEDPLPDAGVIAEVITTTNNQNVLISPATIGFNAESPVTTSIPITVTNLSGTTQEVTVTMTYIKMEG